MLITKPIPTLPTRKARNQITKDTKPPITTHLTRKTRKTRNPSLPPHRFGGWGGVVSCLSYFFVLFVIQTLHAATPYQPVQPDPVLESWRWRSFPELKGLGLQCMAEDKDGNMWFGTNDGVRRYDGVNWTAYTPEDGLLGAPVNALCVTRDGSVYAGTRSGISRFSDGKWRPVFPPEGDLPWFIWDLMEASDGSLWAATGRGALRLDREELTFYTTEETGIVLKLIAPYVRLAIVPDEAAPSLPWREGIGVRANRGLIFDLAPGGPGEAAGLKVGDRILTVDGIVTGAGLRAGRALRGPAGAPVTLTVQREGRAEPFELSITRERVEGAFRVFSVGDVYEDREGAMWFGVFGGEIVRYDIRGTESDAAEAWRLYTEEDGLDIGWGLRILQTRDGVIWTVSDHAAKGVNRFDGKTWTNFHLGDLGLSDTNPSILETADGTLWVGGNGSLYAYRSREGNATRGERLDGETWTFYGRPDVPIPSARVIGLLEASDGALWLASLGQEAVRLDYRTSQWTSYEGLVFQCETPDGAQWFLSQDGGVVRYNRKAWTRYGIEDGLMDAPVALITTRHGSVWAAGSHDTTAATARFGGRRWSLKTHPRLSWNIHPGAVYESSDGALWFGTDCGTGGGDYVGGVLRYGMSEQAGENIWTHYTPPEAPRSCIYGIGQTADGVLWFGGTFGLRRFDGQTWTTVTEPEAFTTTAVNTLRATSKGDLWVGTRNYGVFYYNQKGWTRYDVRDGLADNQVVSILHADDGSVWAVTSEGVSRFDGEGRRRLSDSQDRSPPPKPAGSSGAGRGDDPVNRPGRGTWTTQALPPDLISTWRWGGLQQSGDGALWINNFTGIWTRRTMPGLSIPEEASSIGTLRYEPDADPPDTEITLSLDRVSQPGNTTLAWKGADPWRSTPDAELQYAYRMDGGEWSAFSSEKNHIFQALGSGDHAFEVKARDRDFNEDPTPAAMHFTVVPPVWQEPWFIGLMVVLLSGIGFQTGRVIRRDKRLRDSNTALSAANKELFGLNREFQEANQELQRDRAVERIRGEVQAMEQASDFEGVLSVLAEDLKTVGLSFDTCGIDVLDKPVETLTMAYFEDHGFQYTTYTIDPEGRVTDNSYHVQAPFPEVIQETLERFIAGEPWQALIGGANAIVEVPASNYGRLRITSSERQDFSEEDIDALRDFASAIALGYARYLDIREIQEQTERKSAFLASMSHELRTPMNAIIGFTRMVLRRSGDVLPERQKDNLKKVQASADHLLNLINSILDLSKIEAGRVDVEPERFDVKGLIASCCTTVNPLVKPGVELKQEVSDTIGEANTDQGRLRQIVFNLLSNALKFTDQGEVAVRTSKANEHLVIAVSDTGTGIPADALETIFEEFQQVKGSDPQHKGTGLGLPITKGFAELLGGSISVQSEVGKGSTFMVRIPAVYQGAEV